MLQVLREGGEGSISGVEHAVAVQRPEDPLQTGLSTLPLPRMHGELVTSVLHFIYVVCAGRLELHPLRHSGLHPGARPLPVPAHAAHQPHAYAPHHPIR